jgi:hypothetical protein
MSEPRAHEQAPVTQTVPLAVGHAEQALFEDRVLAVPQGQRKHRR